MSLPGLNYCCDPVELSPTVIAIPTYEDGDISSIDIRSTIWNDNCDAPTARNERFAKWAIYINEISPTPVVSYPYATLDTPIALGVGSTYQELLFPNGIQDIITAVTAAGGNPLSGDTVLIVATLMNCSGVISDDQVGVEFVAVCCDDVLLTEDGDCLVTEDLFCLLLEEATIPAGS